MINKYKVYSKINSVFSFSEFPSVRILKFKRSKWRNWKLRFLKKESFVFRNISLFRKKTKKKVYRRRKPIRKILPFVNGSIFKQRFGFLPKVKNSYKVGLNLKNGLYQFFDGGLTLKYLKKQCLLKKNTICKFLIKPYFKLDILLWKLKIFSSVRQAHQYIRAKKILVNTKIVQNNFFLKKGDVIHVLNENLDLIKNSGLNLSFIFSFCDVDFYSNKIVILKDIDTINEKDFTLFFNDVIPLRSVIYYLRRK